MRTASNHITHNWTADQARQDALDGAVTINGVNYALNPAVLNALQKWPTFYNAGVIGPAFISSAAVHGAVHVAGSMNVTW